MIKYDQQGTYGIEIKQLSMKELQNMEDIVQESETFCTLFWAEEGEDIRFLFFSNTKTIQALEFMDYFVHDYVIVQGNSHKAQAVLSASFLQTMMLDFEAETVCQLLEKNTETYFLKCHSIYAEEFVKEKEEEILKMPQYTKARRTWAYVKTADIMNPGDSFYLTSMENESKILIEASEDVYIMIGHRGEIYHIYKEKFEKTYEPSEEQLDIFEQMFSYLPEVQNAQTEEFIPLDELAYLCYPKTGGKIYAIPLEHRTKIFNPYNNGEYFLGREGDYMAIRQDDLSDIYIIQKDIFKETYELVE